MPLGNQDVPWRLEFGCRLPDFVVQGGNPKIKAKVTGKDGKLDFGEVVSNSIPFVRMGILRGRSICPRIVTTFHGKTAVRSSESWAAVAFCDKQRELRPSADLTIDLIASQTLPKAKVASD